MNRRVPTNSIRPQLMIDATDWSHAAKMLCRLLKKTRQHRSRVAQKLNLRDEVRFASSLATALLERIFEQPVGPRADRADGPSRKSLSFVIDLRSVLCAYKPFGDYLWH
mgnify:CR=1 FL=1